MQIEQGQIQDQNYANIVFFTCMSTLESLVLANSGQHQRRFRDKLFSHYDEVDYSRKSTRELQSQMQTHLSLMRASQEEYEHKFNTSWKPPLNFNH